MMIDTRQRLGYLYPTVGPFEETGSCLWSKDGIALVNPVTLALGLTFVILPKEF